MSSRDIKRPSERTTGSSGIPTTKLSGIPKPSSQSISQSLSQSSQSLSSRPLQQSSNQKSAPTIVSNPSHAPKTITHKPISTPTVERRVTAADKQPPTILKQASTIEKQPTEVEEKPKIVRQTSSILKETPNLVKQTSAIEKQSLPIVKQPSAIEKVQQRLPHMDTASQTSPQISTPTKGNVSNIIDAKIQKELDELRFAAESATVEREIAEEKLESSQRELQETRDQLANAVLKIEMLEAEKENANFPSQSAESAVYQLQKYTERTATLEQALVKLRDLLAEKVQKSEEMEAEIEILKLNEATLEENQIKYQDQIKELEEQIDANSSAQEMVETLTQQKTILEDKCKKLQEELDFMEEKNAINEEMLETALSENKNLLLDVGHLNVQLNKIANEQRDMADHLVGREQAVAKLEEQVRYLQQEKEMLKGQCQETQSIEQQKHQIENVAYKLNFSESKMAEKEAELMRCKRNLNTMEEQMKNFAEMTKTQSTKLEELKAQLDCKNSEIDELKRTLKDRLEKNGEMEVRKDMAEKKLQTVQANLEAAESKITALKLRLERKEIEYEEIFNRQDMDIVELTAQRDELKERLSRTTQSSAPSLISGSRPMGLMSPPILSMADQSSQQNQQSSSIATLSSIQSNSERAEQATVVVGSLGLVSSDNQTLSYNNADKCVLLDKINEWKHAFDLVSRQNYQYKIKLAAIELDGKCCKLYSSANVCDSSANPHIGARLRPNPDQLHALRAEVDKFKQQVRLSILGKPVFEREKSIKVQAQNYQFSNAQLAKKFRALENDAHYVLSNSNLVRQQFSVST